jgi:hypothetical protein
VTALALAVAGLAAGALVLIGSFPRIAARSGRPRYVVALVSGAAAIAVYQVCLLFDDGTAARIVWPGVFAVGGISRAAALVHASVCSMGAWGLWHLRPWARLLAMGYLGALIASFLVWGLRGGDEDLAAMMAWQMLVLPLLTFGFMYLQRGAQHFRAR